MAKLKKNTGKAPSVQFYYKDFWADMKEHGPEIVGAWMLILCKIWHENDMGQITKSIDQIAKIMQTTLEDANRILFYIQSENIAEVTESNGKITVVNRRAKRDAKLLENNRLRQTAFKSKQKSNAEVTSESANPSSSSSTSVIKYNKKPTYKSINEIIEEEHQERMRNINSE